MYIFSENKTSKSVVNLTAFWIRSINSKATIRMLIVVVFELPTIFPLKIIAEVEARKLEPEPTFSSLRWLFMVSPY